MRSYTVAATALVLAASSYAATITYTGSGAGLPLAIPDNNATGISRTIIVGDVGALTAVSLTLTLNTAHTWAGDLIITLSDGTVTADIIRRIGGQDAGNVGDDSNFGGPYTFIDSGANLATAIAAINATTTLASGSYQASTNIFSGNDATTNPAVLLNSVFAGRNRNATWTLTISDNAAQDTGSLASWSLSLTTADAAVPEPATFGLTGLGLIGIGLVARRRTRETRSL